MPANRNIQGWGGVVAGVPGGTIAPAPADADFQLIPSDCLITPFTILRDSREQAPWFFQNIRADASQGGKPWIVKTRWHSLGDHCGDYTIEGAEAEILPPAPGCPDRPDCPAWRVSVERKSIADLYGTILSARERFTDTLENLNRMEYAAVVVEGDWRDVTNYTAPHWAEQGLTPARAQARRKTVVRSILAWQLRYERVRWWLMPGRAAAEVWAFRLLERFWKERMRGE